MTLTPYGSLAGVYIQAIKRQRPREGFAAQKQLIAFVGVGWQYMPRVPSLERERPEKISFQGPHSDHRLRADHVAHEDAALGNRDLLDRCIPFRDNYALRMTVRSIEFTNLAMRCVVIPESKQHPLAEKWTEG